MAMLETRLSPCGSFSVRGHEAVAAAPSFTYTAGICSDCGAGCTSQVVSYDSERRTGHARCWECHKAQEGTGMIYRAWCPTEERCADGCDYTDVASAEIAAADYALLFAKRFGGSALTIAVESEGLPRRLVRVWLDGERIARLEATDAPECVPGVRCTLTAGCMLAAHHMGDCDPDLTPCERCGAQPWEMCR